MHELDLEICGCTVINFQAKILQIYFDLFNNIHKLIQKVCRDEGLQIHYV